MPITVGCTACHVKGIFAKVLKKEINSSILHVISLLALDFIETVQSS